MTKPSLSHHLNTLKQANLVLRERQGQHILYSLNTTVLQEVMGWFLDLAERSERKGERNEQRMEWWDTVILLLGLGPPGFCLDGL